MREEPDIRAEARREPPGAAAPGGNAVVPKIGTGRGKAFFSPSSPSASSPPSPSSPSFLSSSRSFFPSSSSFSSPPSFSPGGATNMGSACGELGLTRDKGLTSPPAKGRGAPGVARGRTPRTGFPANIGTGEGTPGIKGAFPPGGGVFPAFGRRRIVPGFAPLIFVPGGKKAGEIGGTSKGVVTSNNLFPITQLLSIVNFALVTSAAEANSMTAYCVSDKITPLKRLI
mmetsp:Transcript_28663/g.44380  ORF Transcript_28663/g.44380 Transcript_28663/m.44380 type:complete len:228 (+) Transcript_28663:596-1279(+)